MMPVILGNYDRQTNRQTGLEASFTSNNVLLKKKYLGKQKVLGTKKANNPTIDIKPMKKFNEIMVISAIFWSIAKAIAGQNIYKEFL